MAGKPRTSRYSPQLLSRVLHFAYATCRYCDDRSFSLFCSTNIRVVGQCCAVILVARHLKTRRPLLQAGQSRTSSMVMIFDCFGSPSSFVAQCITGYPWIFYRESEASFAHLLGAHVHHWHRPSPTPLFEHLLHRSPHQSCSATLPDQVQAWLWHTADTRTKRTWPALVSYSSW